jgi:hypothetical protein
LPPFIKINPKDNPFGFFYELPNFILSVLNVYEPTQKDGDALQQMK